jgi:hypothetical protein
MADILSLTKLNYNSCRHSDGLPVTLKFADAVGEIRDRLLRGMQHVALQPLQTQKTNGPYQVLVRAERNFGRSNSRSIAAGALYDLSIDLQNLMVERQDWHGRS